MNDICPIFKTGCNHGYPVIDGETMSCNAFGEHIAIGYDYLDEHGWIDKTKSVCSIFGSW